MSYLWLSSSLPGPGIPDYPGVLAATTIDEAIGNAASGKLRALIVQVAGPCGAPGIGRDAAFDLLEHARSLPPVWILDVETMPAAAVRWIRAGAAEVYASLAEITRAMNEPLTTISGTVSGGRGFIGASEAFATVIASIHSVAARRCNVLIEGETGTGKEVVAREIHFSGPRAKAPFIAVNCAAIPDTLLEAELFGHSKGAFTGAVQARAGKFEAANHGTIFLDEIGDMPLGIQAKLLRVLQEREVERLGGNEKVRLDVRILAATNVDLAARVRQGLFRQDLYYRLNVFSIRIPALRERPEDIRPLAQHFTEKICRNEGIPVKIIDRSALGKLEAHDWPGNVRELENMIESAIIRSGPRTLICAADIEFPRAAVNRSSAADRSSAMELPAGGIDYQKAVEEFEHAILTQALARTRGNKTAAAALLGLKRTTLTARMRAIESRFPRLVA